MAANIITTEDLEQFKDELFVELKNLLSFQKENDPKPEPPSKWLKSYQVQRLLGISPGTLQNLRINGTLPYTKIGGIILYSQEDINSLIQGNMRNPFKDGKK